MLLWGCKFYITVILQLNKIVQSDWSFAGRINHIPLHGKFNISPVTEIAV